MGEVPNDNSEIIQAADALLLLNLFFAPEMTEADLDEFEDILRGLDPTFLDKVKAVTPDFITSLPWEKKKSTDEEIKRFWQRFTPDED